MPGAGKTTVAEEVCERVNRMNRENVQDQGTNTADVAIVLPMDGFHYTRAQLDKMENPEEAHRRRGAPFTFDAEGLLNLVKKLQDPVESRNPIYAPSFDHSIGDPIENDICILPSHNLIILEGLYLHLTTPPPWSELPQYFNQKWFINVQREEAISRLVKRHVDTGVAKSIEEARDRVLGSDLVNGDFLVANRWVGDVDGEKVRDVVVPSF
ncbi:hypothetical protein HDU76_009721 [Blyttiomyces sp. JEL0837]|nr:hypothetical protein HDU76_009721 [Blyttiomyces sp. JEL0837]